ncbi:MAG: hypothetical protein JXJ20_14130 [Anaerolineae bacterium]|nr:hypothetical protein [Anaerolineae bacterium]
MDQPPNEIPYSQPYKMMLTIAILLFLAMLTAVVILIIIARGRELNLEEEFDETLTAAFANVSRTETAVALSPTPAPAVVRGSFPFELADDSPAYSAAPTCDEQTLTGLVLNQNNAPTDGFGVLIWGDYTAQQTLLTGEVAGQDKGRWSLALPGMIHRRVWVQLVAGDRHFTAPVEIVFDQQDCSRNQVNITLRQITPLE